LVTDPRGWFACCDIDFGGELSQYEVVEALGATLLCKRNRLEKHIRSHWSDWDPDGDGSITLSEFVRPGKGLRDWIIKHRSMLLSAEMEQGANAFLNKIPALDRHPRHWFQFWDKDASGTLEREELVRSLIRTFCVDERGKPLIYAAHDMRESALVLWKSCGYKPFDNIAFDEFVKPYGLMDQFLHNQSNLLWFGDDDELLYSG
jgi:Ca2+-binding EF-hand superfamily protein